MIHLFFKRKPINQALILAYHRIFNPVNDPILLSVNPENFESQLKIISQHYKPISLPDLAKAIRNKSVPNRAIVLTFDDGYVDNLLFAKPLLEKYQIPATIFITTHGITNLREPWWDELEKIILLPPSLPKKLSCVIANKSYHWDITVQKDHVSHLQGWNISQNNYPNDRFKLYMALHNIIKLLLPSQQEEIINFLSSWANVPLKNRPHYRIMNQQEIQELHKSHVIEIGSHTVTHPQLATQSYQDQLFELSTSKKQLEAIIQQPVTSFSYPFGNKYEIGRKTPKLVSLCNYNLAVANYPASITKRTNPFLLPRFIVRNWNHETFRANLKQWFKEQ